MNTILVTNANTSGVGSLYWAIAQANAYTGEEGSRIVFDPSLGGMTINLSNITLTKKTEISNLENKVVINGEISTSAELTINNIVANGIKISGLAVVYGSGNQLKDKNVIRVSNSWNGDLNRSLSEFYFTALDYNAYIEVGDFYGERTFGVVKEVKRYRFLYPTINDNVTLNLLAGIEVDSNITVKGELNANGVVFNGCLYLTRTSKMNGKNNIINGSSGIIFYINEAWKGDIREVLNDFEFKTFVENPCVYFNNNLVGDTVLGVLSGNVSTYEFYNGFVGAGITLTTTEGVIIKEKRVNSFDVYGTLDATGTTFLQTIRLKKGGKIKGSGNIVTSKYAVIELDYWKGNILEDIGDFGFTENGSNNIIVRNLVAGESTLGVVNDGRLFNYTFASVIGKDVTLNLLEGVNVISNISIDGNLNANNVVFKGAISLSGNSSIKGEGNIFSSEVKNIFYLDSWKGDIREALSEFDFSSDNVNLYINVISFSVNEKSTLGVINNGQVKDYYFSGAVLDSVALNLLEGVNVLNAISVYGKLNANGAIFNGGIYLNKGMEISGDENIINSNVVFVVRELIGESRKLWENFNFTATSTNPCIKISSFKEGENCTLSKLPAGVNYYSMPSSSQKSIVSKGCVLTLDEKVAFDGDIPREVNGTLLCKEGSSLLSKLVLNDGGSIETNGAKFKDTLTFYVGSKITGKGNVFDSAVPFSFKNCAGNIDDVLGGLENSIFTNSSASILIESWAGDVDFSKVPLGISYNFKDNPGSGIKVTTGNNSIIGLSNGILNGTLECGDSSVIKNNFGIGSGIIKTNISVFTGTVSLYKGARLEGEGNTFSNVKAFQIRGDFDTTDLWDNLKNSQFSEENSYVYIYGGGYNFHLTELPDGLTEYLMEAYGNEPLFPGATSYFGYIKNVLLDENAVLNIKDYLDRSIYRWHRPAIYGVLECRDGSVIKGDAFTVKKSGEFHAVNARIEQSINIEYGAKITGEGNEFSSNNVFNLRSWSGTTLLLWENLINNKFSGSDVYVSVALSGNSILTEPPKGISYRLSAVESGISLEISPHVIISSQFSVSGDLIANNVYFSDRITLLKGGVFSGEGNTFKLQNVLYLYSWSGDTVDVVSGLKSGKFESLNPYISVYLGGNTVLSETDSGVYYRIDFIESNREVVLNKNAILGDTVNLDGVLKCLSHSVLKGLVNVRSGGLLDMDGSEVSGSINVAKGGKINILNSKLNGNIITVQAGTQCVFIGNSGKSTLSLSAGASFNASGNDFSEMKISISGSPSGGSIIDLSGNYWGEGISSVEDILGKITGNKSQVVINDWLLVDPTTQFMYQKTSLHNNYIVKGEIGFDVFLTHEIDVDTFGSNSVSLVDVFGNNVLITDMEVSGRKIHIEIEPSNHGAQYRLILSEELKDIKGNDFVNVSGLDYSTIIRADFVAPRVVRMEPGGDFTGTLSEIRLYFSEGIDVSSLRSGLVIKNAQNQNIAVQGINDLGGGVYQINFVPQTTYGSYSVQVNSNVMDMAGNQLNQNGNDVYGEESDVYTGQFTITDVDLTITDVQVDGSLKTGEDIKVKWSGENATGYELKGKWTDGVYLSKDNRWDVDDLLLGSLDHTNGLATGLPYSGELSLNLPGVVSGDYDILVRSDINGQEKTNKTPVELAQNLFAHKVTITIPELSVGESRNGSMNASDSFDYYVLKQGDKEALKLQLNTALKNANLEVYVGYGRVPTRESYDQVLYNIKGSGELVVPGRAGGGDIYILVNNKTSGMNLDYTLSSQTLPMTVTSVTPTTQANFERAVFDIYGVNFTAGTKVVFVDSKGVEYAPSELTVITSERIRIKFEGRTLPSGKLDLVVRSGSETVSHHDLITITASSGAHLKIASELPSSMGYSMQHLLKIAFENTGTDPMHAPLLSLTGFQDGKAGAIMTMDPTILNQGFWTNAMPEGFGNTVTFLAYSPGTPGWIMPTGRDNLAYNPGIIGGGGSGTSGTGIVGDQSGKEVISGDGYRVTVLNDGYVSNSGGLGGVFRPVYGGGGGVGGSGIVGSPYAWLSNIVNIYYAGWQQPWSSANSPFNFQIGYLGTDNTTPLNWNEAFVSGEMDSALSQMMANSLTSSVGGTWGDYVMMLNKNLIYLDELGCIAAGGASTFDTDSLMAFELMKANGSLTPVKTLSSSVDMVVPTTGLGLGISRVYQNNVTSRFENSDFGYGWTHNWDVKLTFREDGTVIMNAAGAQRVYQPDYRGGYQNASGDHAVLTKKKDGTYLLTEREGLVWTFSATGSLISQTEMNGNKITCSYDSNGHLIKLTHSNGEFIALEWNDSGQIIRLTDTRGDTVQYDYAQGNLVKATNYQGDSVIYEYSGEFVHALTAVIGKDGISSEFVYDQKGLLKDSSLANKQEQVFNYGKVTLTYGDNGEVTATDVYGATSTYFYDNKGQVRRAIDSNGNTLSYGYDDKGNMIWVTDQSGNTSAYTYDAYGNLTSSTNALGYTTHYTYTDRNKLDILTDALGHTIDYEYDAKGNVKAVFYADGSSESWTYDAVGNADAWTNRRGKTIRSEYDQAGRVTALHYEDGSSESFTYDARGNLLTAVDATGTSRYTYDARERVVKIEMPNGHSLSYTYDENDRRSSMTDECNNVTRYEYTAMGLLKKISDGEGCMIVEYGYDQGGRLLSETNGNGTTCLYEYTKAGQIDSLTHYDAEGVVASFCKYTYDKVGLRTSMTTQDGVWSYGYDKTGQLTSALFSPAAGGSESAQSLFYEYDAAGNRTKSVVNGVETLFANNNLNQTTSAGDVLYEYDADGNLVKKVDTTGVTLYSYNDSNQLVGVQTGAGDVYAYVYNAFGDRVSVTVNGKTTDYVYDPSGYGNLVGEYDAETGDLKREYTHGNGLIGFDDAKEGRYWYQGDALGSVMGITDDSGNMVANYIYDPFGRVLSSSGSLNNPFQWVGTWGLSNEGNGLTYMRARYYDQETGKFISADPIGIYGGENLYAYCGNNGVSFVDPSGLFKVRIVQAIGKLLSKKGHTAGESAAELAGKREGDALLHFKEKPNTDAFQKGKNCTNGLFGGGDGIANAASKTQTKPENKLGEDMISGTLFVCGFIPGPVGWAFMGAGIWWELMGKDKYKEWMRENMDYTPIDSNTSNPIVSRDPNDIVGPAGYGDKNYIASGDAMNFMVRFENEKSATAPTHWMRVFNTFDEAFDLDSFTLDSFYLAGNLVTMTEKQDSFNRKVTLNFMGKDILVDVKINLDREERQLKAEFMAIDPVTGFMIQDPDIGMLFPNDETGRGDGYVTYTISTKNDLPTGTTIKNEAEIYFDFNDVIPTPELTYTLDTVTPTSRMLTAVDAGENGEITLTWEGGDDSVGSGLWGYYVFVSRDGGEFELWKSFTSEETTATFSGVEGSTYGFFAMTVDNVGNIETEKTVAEVIVKPSSSDTIAPDPVINLKALAQGTSALFTWDAVDDPSGVSYMIEYADNSGWNDVQQKTVETNYVQIDEMGEGLWYWRVKAVDGVGNESAWSSVTETLRIDATAPELIASTLTATPDAKTLTLAWAAAEDPSGVTYLVECADNSEWKNSRVVQVPVNNLVLDEMEDGLWYWRVKALDGAGNLSEWAQASHPVRVDTTAPELSAASLLATAKTNTLDFVWGAAVDPSGVSYVLEYSADSAWTNVVRMNVSENRASVAGLEDGLWYWRVKAVDGAGNESQWVEARPVRVDTTAPELAEDSLSVTVQKKTLNFVWGAVADPSGVSYVLEYAAHSDWRDARQMTVKNNNASVGNLTDGLWYWRVKVVDGAGNASEWVTSQPVRVDTTAPELSVDSLTASVRENTLSFAWGAVEDPSGVSYILECADNSGWLNARQLVVTSPGASISDLTDGLWYWRVKAVDGVGNQSGWVVSNSPLRVDSIAPELSQDSLQGAVYRDTLNLSWGVAEDPSGVSYLLEYSDQGDWSNARQKTLTTPYASLSELNDGLWYWRVKAVDGLGNESSWFESENALRVDTVVTEISLESLVGSVQTRVLSLSWDAVDDPSGVSYILEYTQDNDWSVAEQKKLTTNETSIAELADGLWYWRIKVLDGAGNESAWVTSALPLRVDTAAPEVTVESMTAEVRGNELLLAWSLVEDPSGVSYVLEYTDNEGWDNAHEMAVTTNKVTIGDLADGLWSWRVKSVDGLGNESAWSIFDNPLRVDTVAPELSKDTLKALVQEETISFKWGAVEDPSGVSYILEYSADSSWNNAVQVKVATPYASVEDLTEGLWYWRVKAVDGAGNESAWVVAEPLGVDATAPEIPMESLKVEAHGTAAKFSWAAVTDPSGMAGYKVQYALNERFESAFTKQISGTEFIDFDLAGNATYYWRVAAVDKLGNVGEWATGASFTTTVAVDDNSLKSATVLSVLVDNTATATDWVGFGDKTDYFKFSPQATGAYWVGLEEGALESNVYLSVGTMDEKGEFKVLQSLALGPESSLMGLDGLALEKGKDYYFKVSAYDNGAGAYNGAYKLNVKGVTPESVTDNNSADKATSLVLSDKGNADVKGWVGFGDSADFYKFELFDGGNVNLKLADMQMAARLTLFKENEKGGLTQVTARTVRSSGMEAALNLLAGNYLVQVSSYDEGAGRYNTGYVLDIDAGDQVRKPGYLAAL